MDFETCALPGAIIGLVSLIIVILTCWDSVDVTYYGLKCNSFSKNCDTKEVYESGRYFTGPFNYFVQFPGTVQTISFSEDDNTNKPLSTRTVEGLGLMLHISFQYQLRKKDLEKLYQMSNLQYEQTFVKISRDVILQAAGSYQAPSYWTERQKIVDDIKQQLNQELQKAYADVKYFAIMFIDLPDPYEDSIVMTQVNMQFLTKEITEDSVGFVLIKKVETQQKKTKEFEKQAIKIQQELDVLVSENNSKIKFISSQAQADAYNIRQTSQAEYIKITLGAEQKAYLKLKQDCNFNNQELNSFIYYSSVMQKSNSTQLYVGVSKVLADTRGEKQ